MYLEAGYSISRIYSAIESYQVSQFKQFFTEALEAEQ